MVDLRWMDDGVVNDLTLLMMDSIRIVELNMMEIEEDSSPIGLGLDCNEMEDKLEELLFHPKRRDKVRVMSDGFV